MNYAPWPNIGLTETPFDWAKYTGSAALSAKSTAAVEKRRATGSDFSTFRGMSAKADKTIIPGGPKRMRQPGKANRGGGDVLHPESKSGRIREALQHGPMTRAQICAVVGVKANGITAYLANDIKQGRVLKIVKEGELQRFALAEVE